MLYISRSCRKVMAALLTTIFVLALATPVFAVKTRPTRLQMSMNAIMKQLGLFTVLILLME